MKLEIGMYIKLDRCQGIRKIIDYDKEYNWFELDCDINDRYGEYICVIHENDSDILKASFNIIDLIEVGDYVNGYYVEDILKTFINVATGSNCFQSPTIYEQDIKSIVTKEEFEQISYKVGE